jgi:hypothetical protein
MPFVVGERADTGELEIDRRERHTGTRFAREIDEVDAAVADGQMFGSSGQFVGGSEPVRGWVPMDLWITSLLPTGPTGQAGDLWTTSLLPTDLQPCRDCDDKTARYSGPQNLGHWLSKLSGDLRGSNDDN